MLTNHFAIVLDRSGSMRPIRNEVVNQFNAQLETIRQRSKEENQKSTVSLYTFAWSADRPIYFSVDVETVRPLSNQSYSPSGSTAMFDAIGKAVTELSALPDANDENTSFVIMVITDGEENNSHLWNSESIQQLMAQKNATDRWTFAFLVPKSGIRVLERFGVAPGNIQPWEQSVRGVEEYGRQANSAISSYFVNRTSGKKSTTTFFKTDLTNVTPEQLKASLKDVSQDYLRLSVTLSTQVRNFVEITTGRKYKKGEGFYELKKAESIQPYKEIIIQDKKTNQLFGGPSVRGILGLPDYGTIRVHPGHHAGYNIYVQSTSVNRKLSPNSNFLLKVI